MNTFRILILALVLSGCASTAKDDSKGKIAVPVFADGTSLKITKEGGVNFEKGSKVISYKYKNVTCELTDATSLLVTDETQLNYKLGQVYKFRNSLSIYDRNNGKIKGMNSYFNGVSNNKMAFSIFCETENRDSDNKAQYKIEQEAYVEFVNLYFDAKGLAFVSENHLEENPQFVKPDEE